MYVKPQPGRSVPDLERGGLLAAEGREVDATSTYWQRRLDDGDVALADVPEAHHDLDPLPVIDMAAVGHAE